MLATDIDIDHVNDLGWTALIEVCDPRRRWPVFQEIVGLLVDAGAKSIPDRDSNTPLDHARQRGYGEIAARIEAGPRRLMPGRQAGRPAHLGGLEQWTFRWDHSAGDGLGQGRGIW